VTATWRHEAGRKAVHLSMAALPAWIYWVPPPWTARGPVLAFLGILAIDVLRLRSAPIGRFLAPLIDAYLRPDERRGLIRVHWMTGAAALLACVAPPAIAAVAVADVVFGDAAAALVGRRYGRHRVGRKSIEGSVACWCTCFAVAALAFPGQPGAAAGSALVATLVEALPLPVDDNWTMPLAAAGALALLL
jgi:dolichol kinase